MRTTGVCLVVAVVAIGTAFAIGRATAPAPQMKVEERVAEKAHEQVTTTVEATATRDEAKVETVVVYRDRLVHVDGTVEEHEVEHRGTDVQIHEEAKAAEVKVEVREVERVVEKRVEVHTPPPDWRVTAMVGVDASPLVRQGLPPALALGASVERRIIGPIYVGVWGLVQPAAVGASIGFDF